MEHLGRGVEEDGGVRRREGVGEQPAAQSGQATKRSRDRKESVIGVPVVDDETPAGPLVAGREVRAPEAQDPPRQAASRSRSTRRRRGVEAQVEAPHGHEERRLQAGGQARLAGSIRTEERHGQAAAPERDQEACQAPQHECGGGSPAHLQRVTSRPARSDAAAERAEGRPVGSAHMLHHRDELDARRQRGRYPAGERPLSHGRLGELPQAGRGPGSHRGPVQQAVQEERPEGILDAQQGEGTARPPPLEARLGRPGPERLRGAEGELGDDVELEPAVLRRVVGDVEAMRTAAPGRPGRPAEGSQGRSHASPVGRRHQDVDVVDRLGQAVLAAQEAPGDPCAIEPLEGRSERRADLRHGALRDGLPIGRCRSSLDRDGSTSRAPVPAVRSFRTIQCRTKTMQQHGVWPPAGPSWPTGALGRGAATRAR